MTSETTRSAQKERLEKLVRWASPIPAAIERLHGMHGPIAHLRPTSNGVTLVGLAPDRPQRGKGGFRNLDQLVEDSPAIFEKYCVGTDQGRDTPEKELQSLLLRDAYSHGRRMSLLEQAIAASDDPAELLFVADELALPLGDRRRIVCDLLAVRILDDGRHRPVVIELKSERAMKRLVEQVSAFAALVDEHREAFQSLASALLETDIELEGPCERWIIWPAPASGRREPRTQELAEVDIRVVNYSDGPTGLELLAP